MSTPDNVPAENLWPAGTVDAIAEWAEENLDIFLETWQLDALRQWEEKPEPTMAEIQWDDAVHHLAEAALPRGKRVVMIGPDTNLSGDPTNCIICADPAGMIAEHYNEDLTPTGKRYKLTPDGDGMEAEQEAWMDRQLYPNQREYAPGGYLTRANLDRLNRQEKLDSSPRPEDVPAGEAWQVEVRGDRAAGFRNSPSCWVVVYQNQNSFDYMHDADITLVARLTPERARKTLNTEQDYVSAPVGTVLGGDGKPTREKISNDLWVSSIFAAKSNLLMSANTRTVLWGPEVQA